MQWITCNSAGNQSENYVHRRHRERANTCFLDGHVEPLSRDALRALGQRSFSNDSYPF